MRIMSATLYIVSSSSASNGYLLDCNGEQLIIECGVPAKDVFKLLNWRTENTQGCLLTHIHGDHAKYINQYLGYSIPVYAPQSVCDIHTDCTPLEPMKRYKIGGFIVMPLIVPHSDCECLAYHITLPNGQTMLFATDLERFNYAIKDCNCVCIECNYSNEIRTKAIQSGVDVRAQSQTHMELNECINALKRLKNAHLSHVMLLHLSDNLSDAEMFKECIFAETGIKAVIAEKNTCINLESEDF